MPAWKSLLSLAVALTLPACATVENHDLEKTALSGQSAKTLDDLSPNEYYRAVVNLEARRRGINVIWINPPRDR